MAKQDLEKNSTQQEDSQVSRKLELLLKAVSNVYPPLGKLLFRSFLQGLFGALGATIGLTIFIAFFAFLFNQVRLLPIIGEIFTQIRIEQLWEPR